MRLPSPIRIGLHKVTAKFYDFDDQNQFGDWTLTDLAIRIREGMAPSFTAETLWHEIQHAVWEFAGLERDSLFTVGEISVDERVIRNISPGTLQVLRDNPRLLDFLLGGEEE